jgi:hypothetical protein
MPKVTERLLELFLRGKSREWVWSLLPWLIIALGAGARIYVYGQNRSLWLDEVFLAEDLLARNANSLFSPLMNGQAAPFGFVAAEVAVAASLGYSEYSLRLFPLLSSLLTLFIFYVLVRSCLAREARLLSLGIVALSSGLIYFSSELKPYAVDSLATCALLAVGWHYFRRPTQRQRFILLALTGAFAVWFSYPSVFVLTGLAAAMAVQWHRSRSVRRTMTPVLAGVWLSWGVSFALHYWLWISRQFQYEALHTFWTEAFLPTQFWTAEPFQWLYLQITRNLGYPVGFSLPGIGLVLLSMGLMACARRRDPLDISLIGALVALLVASSLHFYPVYPRLVVFSVPLVAVGAGHRTLQ